MGSNQVTLKNLVGKCHPLQNVGMPSPEISVARKLGKVTHPFARWGFPMDRLVTPGRRCRVPKIWALKCLGFLGKHR